MPAGVPCIGVVVVVEMNKHDLEAVPMTATPDRRHLALAVPDLMERRPSVRVADVVEVTYSSSAQSESGMPVPNGVKYRGYVAVVRKDDILVHVPQELQSNHRDNESLYDVRFFLGRVMEKRKHHALHLLESQVEWLFPSPLGMGEVSRILLSVSPKVLKSAVEDSSNVGPLLNEEQGKAFQDIIRLTELSIGGGGKAKSKGRAVPPPYILHGPPGTGKTTTIVKAICYIYKRYPSSRILACAATNSAADSLLLGLVGCGITSILRLNAHTRPLDGLNPVPEEVMRYSNRHSGGGFQTPTREEFLGHRVVVSTSCSASGVWQAGMEAELYSHVFVDEASSMVEPECLIPIACCLHPQSVVVLAGDPQQLGPVVHCLLCKGMDGSGRGGGLEMSLLERLMTSEPSKSIYMNGLAQDGGCGPVPRFFATKLVRNYRSHRAILELPSRLFYNNELVAESNVQLTSSLCRWAELPNKNEFPILFHAVDGTAMRDEGSPSFFNAEECAQVVRYVEKLLADQTLGLRSAEIGVVAPYRRQVQKLQHHLHNKLQFDDIKVGSVEEFQGQERRVIILTTVRSDPAFVQDEYTQNIGFIKNPKRLNVAITRAMHLLIIVGNPKALKPDANWRKLLEYCVDNHAYVGCPLAEQQL
ncbi:hypothetical protein CBR_g44368 [Chara braunii]|uniref:RNA helicase n=1 Tax=Chara braunii TaxID=69332 RepID=A0A388LXF5_CHABU|nr:hypothetical protein CBR_g44368 [Chara braunii]|eukprot:GBG86912.1 hypothetical protein CBR_g44368 [Chara braunii]